MNLEDAKNIAENEQCLDCLGKLIIGQKGLLNKKYYLKCSSCGKIWENAIDYVKNETYSIDYFGVKQPFLKVGNCTVFPSTGDFIDIAQNDTYYYLKFDISNNKQYIVAWEISVNPLEDKNKQICLIDGNIIRWVSTYEHIENASVSNNGTMSALLVNYIPSEDVTGKPGYRYKHTILLKDIFGYQRELIFNDSEEIMAIGLSENGSYLLYNIQRYRPNDYVLICVKTEDAKQIWSYNDMQNIVVHEIRSQQGRFDIFSGPRPSAYVDRKYDFSLDYSGKVVQALGIMEEESHEEDTVEPSKFVPDFYEALELTTNENIIDTLNGYMLLPLGPFNGTAVLTSKRFMLVMENPFDDTFRCVVNVEKKRLSNYYIKEIEYMAPSMDSPKEARFYFESSNIEKIKNFIKNITLSY